MNQGILQCLIEKINFLNDIKDPKPWNKLLAKIIYMFLFWLDYSSLTSVTPENKRITRKNKSKEKPAVSIIRKDPIRKKVTTSKISQAILECIQKTKVKKMSQSFQHKVDYGCDTDDS